MPPSTRFILNDREVESAAPAGLLVLDFLRDCERLTGTKEGCKEGDCGACAILIGELEGDAVRYQPVTSCLVPLAEVHRKHVVTIEGCNQAGLNPVQEAIVEFGGTQCGFCTPGIVVSLHGLLLDGTKGLSLDDVKYALSGHLCRCTGYRSLKDCAATLDRDLGSRLQANGGASRVPALTAAGALPEYFAAIPERLRALRASSGAEATLAEDATAHLEPASDAGKGSAPPVASASRSARTSKPPPGTAPAPRPATVAERLDDSRAAASLSDSSRAASERGLRAEPGRTALATVASTASEPEPPDPAAPARTTQVAAPSSTVPSGPLAVAETEGTYPRPPVLLIAGGTDLYVQQGEAIPERRVTVLGQRPDLRGIRRVGGEFRVGALTMFEEFGTHPAVTEAIPAIASFNHLIASWQIRNRATLAGNIVNASPIGDYSVLLLALDARVVLDHGDAQRTVSLREFYRGYKQIDLRPGELLTEVAFADPAGARVNFEKVSKRTCLDIASVNSACSIRATGDMIDHAHFSLGGVAPVPLYLHETSRAVLGRSLDLETAWEAVRVSQQEIAPISDVRGSAEYKRLLARQLLIAHFVTLFPDRLRAEAFYAGERRCGE
ncbi:MAG: FAD binding domain-containing protein [Spirochaetaceae bacterium]|nr:FAD binding domain-containing protein [Spirochaetaceae bacterium]